MIWIVWGGGREKEGIKEMGEARALDDVMAGVDAGGG